MKENKLIGATHIIEKVILCENTGMKINREEFCAKNYHKNTNSTFEMVSSYLKTADKTILNPDLLSSICVYSCAWCVLYLGVLQSHKSVKQLYEPVQRFCGCRMGINLSFDS